MMHRAPRITAAALVALSCAVTADAAPAARQRGQAQRVHLAKAVERAPVPDPSSMLGRKFANLAQIDPEHPLVGQMAGQTLSLFGREDLIAATSYDYKASACTRLAVSGDVMAEIVERAKQTSIVVVSESHERSEHRGFIAEVARRLRPLGYDTLAIETLSNSAPNLPTTSLPPFLSEPDLSYFDERDGYYLSEAGFGRLGRLAKALGYRLIPYEFVPDKPDQPATREEQIASREEAQASNLAAFLTSHPKTKLIVHVGYSHAAEVPRANGEIWMAARLKQKTGIDLLTISQTTCRGGGPERRLSSLPAREPAGTFDLVVDHPSARFERGRPEWRKLAGDHAVSIPSAPRPVSGWRVVEARPVGEPARSVPMDRVAIRPGEDVALMLPPGRYSLRIIDLPRAEPPGP